MVFITLSDYAVGWLSFAELGMERTALCVLFKCSSTEPYLVDFNGIRLEP